MPNPSKAIAFDVDGVSVVSLREALPGWQIDVVHGATVGSLPCDWDPGAVDLLVVGTRAHEAETWELCRFLAHNSSCSQASREKAGAEARGQRRGLQDQGRRTGAPVLVLLPAGREALTEAALEAGADSCLVLPVHAKEVAGMLVHTRAGNQPGRHTLNLDRAQIEDRWRDDGGQG